MRTNQILPSLAVLASLAGCAAFEPDYYNCNSLVTSYAQGARASLISEATLQNVEVRFNGVSARCYDEGTDIIAEVGIGLKVSRELSEGQDIAPVSVPMLAAIIDEDEAVISRESFVYTMQFTNNLDVIYPLVRREFNVPQGGRLILSLTPTLIGDEAGS